MSVQNSRARDELLDAAEELFARNGIDAVSNRRIVEFAGAANHSAVAYHFGGRDGLIRALVLRHHEEMAERRRVLAAQLGSSPNIHDLVAARLRPLIELLDSLPRPSWRAQFLSQISAVPSAFEAAKEALGQENLPETLRFINGDVDGIPESVLRGRAYLLGSMVVGVCADQEAKMNEDSNKGSWEQVGRFLVDAAAGMLGAPVTDPDGAVRYPNMPML